MTSTTISDMERREVARRLRELCLNPWDDAVCEIVQCAGIACCNSECHGSDETPECTMVLAHRLADLIEPEPERTCHNLNPPSCRDFECSECGESSEFTPGFMPNYCPQCGARVEEASDDADR